MIRIVPSPVTMQAAVLALTITATRNVDADYPSRATGDVRSDSRLTAPIDRRILRQEVIARSPAVRASQERARAMRTEAKREGSLPPPEAMGQVWQVPLSRPYALDAQMIMVGVSQQFPSPGALGAREESMAALAQGEEAVANDRARQVAREIGHVFADYSESSAKQRLHRAAAQAARHLLDVARARHAAGGSLGDPVRALVDASRADADVLTNTTLVQSAKARINVLLGRPPAAALGDPIETDPQIPLWDLESLLARARSIRPEVRRAQAEQQAQSLSARAADREASWPSFTLGALYFPPTQMNAYHGYGATASMSLPWLWGGAGDRRAAQKQYLDASTTNIDAVRISVDADVASAATMAHSAAVRLQMLRDSTLPAARQAFEIAQAGYESGRADLLMVLEARRSVFEIERDVVAARASLDHALTDLEAAVGIEVPTRQLEPLEMTTEDRGGSHAR